MAAPFGFVANGSMLANLSGGIPQQVWAGYDRFYAHSYFEAWNHWSTAAGQQAAPQ